MNNLELIAKDLVKCGYAVKKLPKMPTEQVFVCVACDSRDFDTVEVDPFANTLESRRQHDALIAKHGVNRIIEFDICGWSVECFTSRMATKKEMDQYGKEIWASDFVDEMTIKANRIVHGLPVLFEGKHIVEAENKCLKLIYDQLANDN